MTEITILIIATALWAISLTCSISLIMNPTRAIITWGEILSPKNLQWTFWKALLKIYRREIWLLFFSPLGLLYLIYYLLRIFINGITALQLNRRQKQATKIC